MGTRQRKRRRVKRTKTRVEQVREPRSAHDLARAIFSQADRKRPKQAV